MAFIGGVNALVWSTTPSHVWLVYLFFAPKGLILPELANAPEM